ncbi:TLD-domain-containing protein [Mycena pura]|uniref:Oxidation resistance protein 1 n=1 Tax=Mycena pura TaxID=153505 RepID=A0AAD6VD08_9AGAR|nr:TLD-domain-containing protein [Mycena pura]
MSDSPINSIPSLIPLPASTSPPPARKSPAQPTREADDAFDKFSNLFLPPTPHASPIPSPVQTHRTHTAPQVSPDFEFGSFVSVPAPQDPLSLSAFDPISPLQPESSQPRRPSETFFRQFSQSARDRTQTNRGLLDELLLHEDDPMYWLNEGPAAPAPPEDDLLPSEKPNPYMTESLSDLDFDFFATPQTKPPPAQTQTPQRRSSSVSSLSTRSPTGSPILRPARTPAPPLASQSTSADAPGFDADADAGAAAARMPSPLRTSSIASLTASLSKSSGAKWVAAFLPAAPAPSAAAAAVPNTGMFPPSPSPSTSPASAFVLPHPQHAAPRARVAVPVPEISHFTPFAPAHAHGAYVPPTGAPGFRAPGYDWDRGFSRALERDLGVGAADADADLDMGQELVDVADGHALGHGNGAGAGAGTVKRGVGVLLEKKMNGLISLEGRKEGTATLLTPGLVALIHPHLPALLRLPRQWTLFYSVDQHGISLNTLYSRCGPPASRAPHPKGALVVIQDAEGVLFGVWVADGLQRSTRGGYYGGGESFLWRYPPSGGTLDVYKWTGKNDYVALCEDGFISFGGGDGHYGLYLDDSLFAGSSARCPTFDNPPLCAGAAGKSGTVNFECVGLEVWGVGP